MPEAPSDLAMTRAAVLPTGAATKAKTRRPGRRLWRVARTAAVLAVPAYFLPIPTALFVLCGVLDVMRHRNRTGELFEKYFTGDGLTTWLLSPVNLAIDLISARNRLVFRLQDFPEGHRRDIEECIAAFAANGERIKAHMAEMAPGRKRSMLVWRWYGKSQGATLQIPEFERERRFIKTIAVSAFAQKERTSRHFGPLRLTFRVLYNLKRSTTDDVFIEVDGVVHLWRDDPLFIFDDTVFHQSVNDAEDPRYCLFMDITRPSPLQPVFDAGVRATGAIAGSFKRLFYRHWSFVR